MAMKIRVLEHLHRLLKRGGREEVGKGGAVLHWRGLVEKRKQLKKLAVLYRVIKRGSQWGWVLEEKVQEDSGKVSLLDWLIQELKPVERADKQLQERS